VHYDLEKKEEVSSEHKSLLDQDAEVVVGITAGASCPNNLIESTVLRICALRNISEDTLRNLK